MRRICAILVTLTFGCVGVVLGTLEGAAASWLAVGPTAFLGLLIGPLMGTALIAAVPDVVGAEKWGPGDLFLPALVSASAFSFVVAQVIYTSLAA